MNSKIKKYILIFAAVILILAMTGCDSQPVINTDVNSEFSLSLVAENKGFTYNLKWWQPESPTENEYYIAVPYAIKDKKLKIEFERYNNITINGVKYKYGDTVTNFIEGENLICTEKEKYKLFIYYTSNIPSVHISTKSGTLESVLNDIDYKEPAEITILDDNGIVCSGNLEYIKGRGNASWGFNKRPFNIKFTKKVDLFGMGKSKRWSLISNYKDNNLLKNETAFKCSELIGLKYTPETEYVDLFIDNEYWGTYSLTESIEINPNRIRLFDLEKMNESYNSDIAIKDLPQMGEYAEGAEYIKGSRKWINLPETPDEITGGYLLEFQLGFRYNKKPCGFVTNYGQQIVLKYPEYASKEEVDYIADYYQEFEDAVLSETGYNSLGKHYSEYMDMESMAKMYIVQEYGKNLDAGITSFFLCKDVGKKFVAAPIWDFDIAFGKDTERYGINLSDPYGVWASDLPLFDRVDRDKLTILTLLFKHDDFRKLARKEWEENMLPEIDNLIDYLDKTVETIYDSACIDKLKWRIYDRRDYDKTVIFYNDNVDSLKNFLIERRSFMTEYLSQF